MDEKEGVKKSIKTLTIDLIVSLVSVAYVLYSMVTIHPTDLSIWECIMKSLLSIVVGILIKQMIGENGFTKAYESEFWAKEMEKYNNACNTANQYMERVNNFYYCEEIEKRKKYRKTILMGVRLKYEMFFDEYEDYIEGGYDLKKLTWEQSGVLNKAINVKVYNLNLFSEYSTETSANIQKETGDAEQRVKTFGSNLFGQIVTAIIGVYFVVELQDWNWATFIASLIQVVIWICFGIMQLYTNYNYVIVDKVNKLKKKKELIQKFTYGCEKGMYVENPYETREREKKLKEIEMKKGETQDDTILWWIF